MNESFEIFGNYLEITENLNYTLRHLLQCLSRKLKCMNSIITMKKLVLYMCSNRFTFCQRFQKVATLIIIYTESFKNSASVLGVIMLCYVVILFNLEIAFQTIPYQLLYRLENSKVYTYVPFSHFDCIGQNNMSSRSDRTLITKVKVKMTTTVQLSKMYFVL